MQLALTVLGKKNDGVVEDVIFATVTSHTTIVDLKSSIFSDTCCAHLLIEGNWNQISKFESIIHAIEKKFDCKIHSHRVESEKINDSMLMTIEIIGLANCDLLGKIGYFFREHQIDPLEVLARVYPAPYLNTPLMSAKFVIPLGDSSLFQLRDELMYLCDSLNADLLFEPFKMGA
jgi:glycine cleavage system transcriptional repressor